MIYAICQVCESREAVWAFQPFGPDPETLTFTTLGSHYRGFPPIVKVCDGCKVVIQRGQAITYRYKGNLHIFPESQGGTA
jgi:hypothetical protein